MLKGTKRFMAFAMASVMSLGMMSASMAAQTTKIVVDGNTVGSDVAPVVQGGTTLVPARVIFEQIGAKVDWNESKKELTVKTAATDVTVVINSKNARVNGVTKTLETPAQIINGRTLVPLRFIAEAVGATVNWNVATSTVSVNYFTNMGGTIKIGGSTTIQPIAQASADALSKLNPGKLSVTIAGGGSGAGVKGAASGEFNIGNASRTISDAEKAEYSDLLDFTIGKDAIVVITHKDNKVSNLTKQQVYDIFTGKIKNWQDVGGASAPIFVQTREAGSGTLGAFEELALHSIDKSGKIVSTATPHTSNPAVKQKVAGDANAIGFLSLGHLDSTVKAMKINGVTPSEETAISGAYPIVRPLVVCTKGRPSGITAKFIDFYTSPLGKKIMEEEDFIPMP